GIGPVLAAPIRSSGLGLRRTLDDVAFDVDLPAVVQAAQPAFLVAAERERGAAMRAMLVENAQTPGAVAKRHQLFAEQAEAHRRAVALDDFLGQAGGNPVA